GVDQTGRPNVEFMFNAKGGQLFGQLTSANLPDEVQNFYRKLGIVLDGHLFSAPIIKSMIRDRGEISGDFTKEEVRDLVDVLNAGMLPTTLKEKPVSELATGPLLGQDTIRRGALSIAFSLVAVLGFMIFYYRFAGVLASFVMLTNLVLVVAVMILIKAAFTLPGLAGVVLTVGMAVDANVLIYERIREELDRHATLRMAIRNGFARATVTIIDANLTTVITGIVLYIIGSDQVKGFAVTLILGVVLSMFTAVYCSRAVFEIAEKRRWLTKIKMARIPLGGTIDFIGQSRVARALSVIVILVGLVAVVGRGRGLLDIDFTGGVSIQVVFNQDQDIEEIRTTLTARNDVFDDLAVSEVSYPGEPPRRRYVINTSSPDDNEDADEFLGKVKATLQDVFGERLVHHSMTISGGPPDDAGLTSEAPSKPDPAASSLRRGDLPPENLLAAANPSTLLPTQAAVSAAPDQPQPAPENAQGEEAPGDAEAKSRAETADQAKPPEQAKPADQAAPNGQPGEAPKGVEAVTWTVDFGENKMTYATLEQEIQAQIKPIAAGGYFEMTNPEYAKDLDPDRSHSKWTVSLYLPADQGRQVLDGVKASVEATPVFPSSNTIGGSVATDTQWRAAVALLASLFALVVYIWIRFERVMFGVAAVIALVHDVLITLGAVAISAWLAPLLGFALVDEFKISLSVLAAFLALIGYSLNDTIVVFDRIREIRGKSPYLTPHLINTSINQTLARTIITSFTTLIVVVILYALGGQGIRAFAFSLIVGVLVGTYSSIFIAAPTLLWIAQAPPPRDGQAR
ncbi:MAG: protein translocase subunit SecD, partial [Thermoguttaceae bacterium]|nr:protein translocase subunit SecD [Thermoguttaceae bacterium]